MKRFNVEVTLKKTDSRIIKAESQEKAIRLAKDIYERAGYDVWMDNAVELDKTDIEKPNKENWEVENIKLTAKEMSNLFQTPSDFYEKQLELPIH